MSQKKSKKSSFLLPPKKTKTQKPETSSKKKKKLDLKAIVSGDTPPIVSGRKTNGNESCLNCARFASCQDPSKSFNYICGRHKPVASAIKAVDWDEVFRDPDPEEKEQGSKKLKSSRDLKHIKVIKRTGVERKSTLRFSDATSDEFDIEKMIESLSSNTTGIPTDLKVDDRDLPEAPNFVEFCANKQFLNFQPFAKQVEIGANLFCDICLNPKCTDVEYSRNIPVDATLDQIYERVTFLNHGVCPRCKQTRLDNWHKHEGKIYTELAGLAGQRSTKSITVTLISGYSMHRYLKLQNPIAAFNLSPNTILHGTFTATTFKQARETLFDPLYEIVGNSPWFNQYHDLLDDYGERYGEELYKFKDIFFQYNHRRLLVYPAGPDKKNLRGRTRFLGGIDELGWLFAKTQQAMKLDPDEVYTAMLNSFITLRSAYRELIEAGYHNIPPPMFCNVSSPSSSRDKMVRLVKEAPQSKNIYSFHYDVFNMNPRIKPQDLEDQERTDPESFRRDFLAIPPDSYKSFIKDRAAVISCIDRDIRNAGKLEQVTIDSATGLQMTSANLIIRKSEQRLIQKPPRVLTLDAGHTRNSFAACVMHTEYNEEGAIPVLDLAVEVIPKPGEPVSFTDMHHQVITPIIEKMNVCYIAADRWNSLKMLQDIEAEHEIEFSVYSVKYEDMLEVREGFYNQRIMLPRAEIKIAEAFTMAGRNYPYCFTSYPIAHLIVQALTVEDILGKKVDKGQGYTDDLFRAFALGHALCLDEEIQSICQNYTKKRRGGARDLGVVVGSLGGGVSGGVGNVGGASNIGYVASYGNTGGFRGR